MKLIGRISAKKHLFDLKMITANYLNKKIDLQ
jgi:hypothetical protein